MAMTEPNLYMFTGWTQVQAGIGRGVQLQGRAGEQSRGAVVLQVEVSVRELGAWGRRRVERGLAGNGHRGWWLTVGYWLQAVL